MQNDTLDKILEELCKEEQITVNYLQQDKYLAKLTKGGIIKYVLNKQPNPNTGNTLELAKDKQITYEILSNEKIRVVPYKLFWIFDDQINNEDKTERFYKKAFDFLKNENFPIVIKPLNSSGGKGVFKIDALDNFREIFTQYYSSEAKAYFNFVINPFIDSELEYRCIILNNNVELVYAKKRTISWKHNLSEGAIPELNIEANMRNKIAEISKEVCNIMGLRYAGVDFLIDRFGEPIVLEVNGSASLKIFSEFSEMNFNIVKIIYKKMIISLFEK